MIDVLIGDHDYHRALGHEGDQARAEGEAQAAGGEHKIAESVRPLLNGKVDIKEIGILQQFLGLRRARGRQKARLLQSFSQ